MERVAVIMAGGRGERLWPKSRKDQPKQFLFLGGEDKSLIVQTVERMKALTGIKNVFIVTSRDYFEITRKQLPDLPVENIICEPMGKNTTACIGYACQVIKKRMGDAIMMVVPSDHVIKDVKSFPGASNVYLTLFLAIISVIMILFNVVNAHKLLFDKKDIEQRIILYLIGFCP